MGAGDGEVSGESDLSNILNGGVEVLGGTISINVGEEIRWFDRIVSSARASEVICRGNWW